MSYRSKKAAAQAQLPAGTQPSEKKRKHKKQARKASFLNRRR